MDVKVHGWQKTVFKALQKYLHGRLDFTQISKGQNWRRWLEEINQINLMHHWVKKMFTSLKPAWNYKKSSWQRVLGIVDFYTESFKSSHLTFTFWNQVRVWSKAERT